MSICPFLLHVHCLYVKMYVCMYVYAITILTTQYPNKSQPFTTINPLNTLIDCHIKHLKQKYSQTQLNALLKPSSLLNKPNNSLQSKFTTSLSYKNIPNKINIYMYINLYSNNDFQLLTI